MKLSNGDRLYQYIILPETGQLAPKAEKRARKTSGFQEKTRSPALVLSYSRGLVDLMMDMESLSPFSGRYEMMRARHNGRVLVVVEADQSVVNIWPRLNMN